MIKNRIKLLFSCLVFCIVIPLILGFCSFDSYAAETLTSEIVVNVSYRDSSNKNVVKDFKIFFRENSLFYYLINEDL